MLWHKYQVRICTGLIRRRERKRTLNDTTLMIKSVRKLPPSKVKSILINRSTGEKTLKEEISDGKLGDNERKREANETFITGWRNTCKDFLLLDSELLPLGNYIFPFRWSSKASGQPLKPPRHSSNNGLLWSWVHSQPSGSWNHTLWSQLQDPCNI